MQQIARLTDVELVSLMNEKKFKAITPDEYFNNIYTAGTAGIKACGDMSKDTCAAHEAHESLAHG